MNEEKKDRMFQYTYDDGFHSDMISYSRTKIVEDTGLITKEEAETLWEKYYQEVVTRLEEDQRPQMCIWKNCANETDYGDVEKEIDWRDDLKIRNGKIYKITEEEI